jgi:hypothetical protein
MRRADYLTTFMSRMLRNSEGLNLLGLLGPVQASNEIALLFLLLFLIHLPTA